MSSRLDHLVVVAHSLDAGARLVEAALGVTPGPGRRHPHMGTHNLLLALGPAIYLEVVAVDPDAAPPSRPRWFGLDHLAPPPAARLAAWVAASDDIASDACPDLGDVESMEREGRTWRMTATADGRLPLGGAAPLLIQRSSPIHPASVLPEASLRLRELRIRHPAPAQVRALLARVRLGADPCITVTQGDTCALAAEIETPLGLRVLGEA
jgi:hypothetical protein